LHTNDLSLIWTLFWRNLNNLGEFPLKRRTGVTGSQGVVPKEVKKKKKKETI